MSRASVQTHAWAQCLDMAYGDVATSRAASPSSRTAQSRTRKSWIRGVAESPREDHDAANGSAASAYCKRKPMRFQVLGSKLTALR